MFDLENLLVGFSWILYVACFAAMGLALREARHLPLKSFLTINLLNEIPQRFFLYMGLAFLFLVPASIIEGAYSIAAFFTVMSLLQFTVKNYFVDGIAENDDDT